MEQCFLKMFLCGFSNMKTKISLAVFVKEFFIFVIGKRKKIDLFVFFKKEKNLGRRFFLLVAERSEVQISR